MRGKLSQQASLSDHPLSETQRQKKGHAAQHHSLHIGSCTFPPHGQLYKSSNYAATSAVEFHISYSQCQSLRLVRTIKPANRAQTQTVRDTESADRCACVSSRAMQCQVSRRCSDTQIKCSSAMLGPRSVIEAAQAAMHTHAQLAAARALHASVSPVETLKCSSHRVRAKSMCVLFPALPWLRHPPQAAPRPSTR